MTQSIFRFDEITARDVAIVGGKGANLGEMTRAGFPVPPGFCVGAEAYREFTASVETIIAQRLSALQMDNADDVESGSARLREFLIAQPIPADIAHTIQEAYAELQVNKDTGTLPVAVRSSATTEDLPDASFAGQQDTYLNIRGGDALLEHVKLCWASLWTARAIMYRHRQGYAHDAVALAVVVQQMIESEVSGILFTANPVNQHLDEMVLNASWGLGEAIVSGLANPDTWILRSDGEILDRDIATKDVAIEYAEDGGTREVVVPLGKQAFPSLDDAQVRALVALGAHVSRHYARPMDIEWTYARETFYLLQARPITTLSSQAETVNRQTSNVKSNLQHPTSNLQSPISNLQSPLSNPANTTAPCLSRFFPTLSRPHSCP